MPIGDVVGGLFGGGRNLGTAHGSIVIDTGPAEQARPAMQALGRDISSAMEPARRATEEYNRALDRYKSTVDAAIRQGGIGQVLKSAEVRQASRELTAANTVLRNMRREAAGTTTTFRETQAAVRATAREVVTLQSGIRGLQTELTAVGVAAGAATFGGLLSARNLRNYRVTFTQLLGAQSSNSGEACAQCE